MRQKLLLLFIVLSLQIKANVILPDSILSSIPDSVDVSNNEALFYYSERLIGNQFFDKGYFILKQLEHEFEQEGNQLFLAKTIYNIGDYFYFKNEYDEALAVYTDVLSKSRAISDTFLIAKTLNSIGLIHAYNSDANKALNSYLEEIELINQVPYPSYALKNEKLVVLINIIGLYITRDEAENIISYAQTAINLGEELRDSIRLGSAYNLLGVGFRYNKQYEEAKKSFDKSIEIFKDLNDIYYLSFLYVNVGTLYEYLEEFETAIDYTEKGLNGFKRDNYYYGVHTALNNLANIYYKKGDYQNSKKYLLQIIEHESHEKFPTKLKDTYEYLSNTESKLGNYKNAFEYQQKFVALSDSLNNREKMEKYTELQTKFESIQKDYQINVLKTQKIEHELQLRKNKQQISIVLYIASALLIVVFLVILNLRNKRIANKKLVSQNQQIEQKNKQLSDYNDQLTDLNAQLKISQEELSDSNKTKDRFISILAHDLRNPLHNIIGQSYLLSDAYFKLSEADRIRYAKEIKHIYRAIKSFTRQFIRMGQNTIERNKIFTKIVRFTECRSECRIDFEWCSPRKINCIRK